MIVVKYDIHNMYQLLKMTFCRLCQNLTKVIDPHTVILHNFVISMLAALNNTYDGSYLVKHSYSLEYKSI